MKKLLITTISILLTLSACTPSNQISNFDDCAAAGNPIMESYPQQCRTEDGQMFVQDIGNEMDKLDLIRVDSPRPNSVVGSTIIITGEARGMWFFEGSFPIILEDEDGKTLATHYATAQGEWMTEEFVPFTSQLEVDFGLAKKGNLILKKDNPSDIPENDDELVIPIKFEDVIKDEVYLFFYSEEDINNATGKASIAVKRLVPHSSNLENEVLQALFAGPYDIDHIQGARTSEDLQNLREHYIGVHLEFAPEEVDDDFIAIEIAVINFKKEALEILNSAAARQMMIKAPIEATLKAFPNIKDVKYAIEGQIFKEWDA